jgi:hypothetical protein
MVMSAIAMIRALWNHRHSEEARAMLREAIAQAQGEKSYEQRRKSFYTVRKA